MVLTLNKLTFLKMRTWLQIFEMPIVYPAVALMSGMRMTFTIFKFSNLALSVALPPYPPCVLFFRMLMLVPMCMVLSGNCM